MKFPAMTKTNSHASIWLAISMLGIILLSLVSSVLLFKQISRLQISTERSEMVFFMHQYEYELQRATAAFIEAYPAPKQRDSREIFEKWYNILLSRVDSISEGVLGMHAIEDGFDLGGLQQSIGRVETLLGDRQRISSGTFLAVRTILYAQIEASHNYQLKRDFTFRTKALERQRTTYVSYRNSIILSIVTFLIGALMVAYLFRNNKKLTVLQRTLEEKVLARTKALRDTNRSLRSEVEQRNIAQAQLESSQQEIEQVNQQLLYQANYDSLTELANRDLFLERFSQAISRAQRNGTLVALLFLDLDRFKHINDTMGHSFGDMLLKEASYRIKDVLRNSDTAARFGGDEFAVILGDIVDIRTVDLIVGRILEGLARPFRLAGNDAFVSASIGVTIYPADGESTETLLRKADSAMYKAKEQGRNNFQYFTLEMDLQANQRRKLEASLYQALERHEFTLNYQPIFSFELGRTVGAEVLLRWEHPERGFISPADFIPLAEEVGLILPIGEWVLRNACASAAQWPIRDDEPMHIAVNMSSRQFQKSDIASLVEQTLVETGLESHRLVIEITEGLLMSDDEQVLRQLRRIRDLGVGLAIDDFGTGYSSLSYLKKFPISTLKIDQSFIKDINLDEDDNELIRGIISMAHNLRLKVVAEGVESQVQVDFLKENNCKYLQGYFYSKPLKAQAFSDYITSEQVVGDHLETLCQHEL
ncbi:MAG: putative bifunctional diguanylate cyclase/phosphodiesterase [Pseudomonadales bacterium]